MTSFAMRLGATLLLGLLLAVPADAQARSDSLAGQLLVGTPELGRSQLSRTVVYMVEHDTRGALGVVVNRVIGKGRLGMLLRGFGIEQGAEADAEIDLHEGGPVERDRMMVLHSPDYEGSDSVVSERAVLTESIEILRDMATGQGPLHSIVMLGYAGWAPDQLESEIARGSWFTVEADEDLLFDDAIKTKWQRALARHGFDL